MTDDFNIFIDSAINKLFLQNGVKLNIARQIKANHADNKALMLEKLNNLCNCNFFSNAISYDVRPSTTTINTIHETAPQAIAPQLTDTSVMLKLDDLHSQLQTLHAQFDSLTSILNDFDTQHKNLSDNVNYWNNKVDDLGITTDSFIVQINNITNVVEILSNKIANLDSITVKLTDGLTNTNDSLSSFSIQLADLKNLVNNLDNKYYNVQNGINVLNDQFGNLTSILNNLDYEFNNIKHNITVLDDLVNSLKLTSENFNNKLDHTQAQLNYTNSFATFIDNKVDNLTLTTISMNTQISHVNTSLTALYNAFDQLNFNTNNCGTQLYNINNTIDTLFVRLDTINSTTVSLADELTSTNNSLNNFNDQIETLKTTDVGLETRFNSSLDSVISRLDSINSTTVTLTDALTSTNNSLNAHLSLSNVATSNLNIQYNILNSLLANLTSQVGNQTLATQSKNITGAINEIYDLVANNLMCSKSSTFGSFYSCSSLNDTKPTLIATGSKLCAAKEIAKQQCNNWAYRTEFAMLGASKIVADQNNAKVFVSTNSTGNCFNAVGSLLTLHTSANDTLRLTAFIPSTQVVCTKGSSCSTMPMGTTSASSLYNCIYNIPSLEVSCTEEICSTKSITIRAIGCPGNITIPSLTVSSIAPTAGSLYNLCLYSLDPEL